MNKDTIQSLIQNLNKINLESRKKPDIARAQSAKAIDEFILASGSTKEEMIEELGNKLDKNPNQPHLIILIEMLNQYV